MASSFNDKTPPPFDVKRDEYLKWKKRFQLWQSITDVAKAKQGGLLVLRLDDVTQENILELLTTDEIKTDNGVQKIFVELDQMFQVDVSVSAYAAYEEFECYRRPAKLSISEYCREFQQKLAKVKASGTVLSDHVLAQKLLKSANLKDKEEKLIKATVIEMTYEAVTKQLKKVFSNHISPRLSSTVSEMGVQDSLEYKSCDRNVNRNHYEQRISYRSECEDSHSEGSYFTCEIDYADDGESLSNGSTVRKSLFEDNNGDSDSCFVEFDEVTDHRTFTDTETLISSKQEDCAEREIETSINTADETQPQQDKLENTGGIDANNTESDLYTFDGTNNNETTYSTDAQRELQITSVEFRTKSKSVWCSLVRKRQFASVEIITPYMDFGVKEGCGRDEAKKITVVDNIDIGYMRCKQCNPWRRRKKRTRVRYRDSGTRKLWKKEKKQRKDETVTEAKEQWRRRKKKKRTSVRCQYSGTKNVWRMRNKQLKEETVTEGKEQWKRRKKKNK